MPGFTPKIPNGLEELMRGLAKSCIKQNPENLYEFAAEYFENLLRERDGTLDQNYKKFATYKVYRKNKKLKKSGSNDVNNVESFDSTNSAGAAAVIATSAVNELSREKSIEEIILPENDIKELNDESKSNYREKRSLSISSESEINACIKREASFDTEAIPTTVTQPSQETVIEVAEDEDNNNVRTVEENLEQIDDLTNVEVEHVEESDIQQTLEEHEELVEEAAFDTQETSTDLAKATDNATEHVDTVSKIEEMSENNEGEIITKESVECDEDSGQIENNSKLDDNDDDIANMVLDDEMEAAALKIQAQFRGFQAKKKTVTNDEEDEEIEDNENGEKEIIEPCACEIINENDTTPDTENVIDSTSEEKQEQQEDEVEEIKIMDDEESNKNVDEDLKQQEIESVVETESQSNENAYDVEDDEVIVESPEAINEDKEIEIKLSAEQEISEQIDNEIINPDIDVINEVEIENSELSDTLAEVPEMDTVVAIDSQTCGEDGGDDTYKDEKQEIESIIVENENDENIENVDETQNNEILPEDSVDSKMIDEQQDNDNESAVVEQNDEEEQLEFEKIEREIDEIAEPDITNEEGNNLESVKGIVTEDQSDENKVDSTEQQSEEIENDVKMSSLDNKEEEEENQNSFDKKEDIVEENLEFVEGEVQIDEGEKLEENKTQNDEDEKMLAVNDENDEENNKTPIEEEICEMRKIEPLVEEEKEDLKQEENLQNETSLVLNDEQQDEEEKPEQDEDGEEKNSLNEVEYTKLVESDATPVESFEQVNDIENDVNIEQEPEEMKNNESSMKEIGSILNINEISPIELIDEVVNANAEVVARKLFENAQQTTEITQSTNDNEEDEVIEPQLKQETLPSIDGEKIDLSKEVIEVSQDEIEPINDEILKPDENVSEIPDETQVPIDENQPAISMDMNNEESASNQTQGSVVEDEKETHKNENEDADDEIANMVLDDEMEAAALKIQAQFRGHNIRKKRDSAATMTTNEQSETQSIIESVEIDQCSGNDETKESHENEENKQEENILNVEEGQDDFDDNVEVEETQEIEEETQEEAQTDVQEEQQELQETENEETNENENQEEETEIGEEVEEVNNPENQQNDDESSTEQQEQQQETATNNDDDDIANMVLDDEMEAAALKIQAQFRGIKIRKSTKPKESDTTTEGSVGEASSAIEQKDDKKESEMSSQEQEQPKEEVDDEIANMVLDEEMENAALKIQSTFRGHKARKEITKNDDDENNDNNNEEEKKEEEEEKKEEEEATASSSTSEKTAQQLKDEEDIAGIVMDEEMEQTALKIQSVFRRKAKKPAPKDGEESYEYEQTSTQDDETNNDEDLKESEEKLDIGGESIEDEKNSDYTAERYRSGDDSRGCSIDQFDSGSEIGFYERNLDFFGRRTIEDPSLMQGGGVFVEPSYESTDLLASSSGEDRDPDQNRSYSSYDKVPSDKSFEIPRHDSLSSEKSKQSSLSGEEKVIESFDFEAKKDTAEALYYSLKKNEIETKKLEKTISVRENLCDLAEESKNDNEDETNGNDEFQQDDSNEQEEDEDDDDVVVGIRPPPTSANNKRIMPYGMSMDERLLGSILSSDYIQQKKTVADHYPDENFDPLLEETLREHKFLINRESVVSMREFPDGVGDEDTFDDFDTSNQIRRRIMASSISIADSFDFDPSNNKSIIDDDKIRTALETIQSTDSESTIGSAATKIQNVQQRRTSTTTAQYSSIGNSAIDRSLDEFIHSQELKIDRFEEEVEGLNSPPPRKQQESAEEWTDDTTTYTDSEQRRIVGGGVIGIKVEQKSFLTVDERRRTLHREDAIQRNSTREDEDSSKSSNSSEKNEKRSSTLDIAATVANDLKAQDSIIDTEIKVPVIDLKMKAKPVQVSVYPQRFRRQQTMPVQIQTDVIRVIPKHLRKRIKSAEVDKKKRKFEK